MKILKTTLFLLILVASAKMTSASEITDIAQNFVKAVQSKSKIDIQQTTEKLIDNESAQAELKKLWPDYFTLFSLYKLADRIKYIKESYGTSNSTAITSIIEPRTIKGLPSISDLARVKNIPNQIAVRQRNYVSNQDTVRRSPNLVRESNQERINRRR